MLNLLLTQMVTYECQGPIKHGSTVVLQAHGGLALTYFGLFNTQFRNTVLDREFSFSASQNLHEQKTELCQQLTSHTFILNRLTLHVDRNPTLLDIEAVARLQFNHPYVQIHWVTSQYIVEVTDRKDLTEGWTDLDQAEDYGLILARTLKIPMVSINGKLISDGKKLIR